MKTEMKMTNKGTYEAVPCYIQHKCEIGQWSCIHRLRDKMFLCFTIIQCCHDDEYKIEVQICPFCGYKPNETK